MAVDSPAPRRAARLHRSCRERMLFGVCGGLAETLDLDPTIVRLAFVLVTLAAGTGLLVYLILAVVLPVEEGEAADVPGGEPPWDAARRRRRRQHLAAYILIALGLVFLASSLDWLPRLRGDLLWPLALVAVGVFLLLQRAPAR